MTLVDIERECTSWLSGEPTGDNLNFKVTRLSKAIVLLLPVVKAAEAWRVGRVDAPPITLAEMDLLRAIDQMRAALAKEK